MSERIAEQETIRFATTRLWSTFAVTLDCHVTGGGWHERATLRPIDPRFDGSRVTMTESVVPASHPAHNARWRLSGKACFTIVGLVEPTRVSRELVGYTHPTKQLFGWSQT